MTRPLAPSDRPLSAVAGAWWTTTLAGQWAFFYYIAAFYGASVLSGELEVWNRLAAFGRHPFVAGDHAGNAVFATHALGAGIIALGGALQLLPQLRARFPRFHRWNGRLFLLTVAALSLSGFYLVWVRGPRPSDFNDLSTSFNGLLILGFAVLAYRAVRARDIASHRRWALRLYLVANAQWFLRVGVFAYFLGGRALGLEVGMGDSFMRFWTFGSYLVPLALLQAYFLARASHHGWLRLAVAALIGAATLAMAGGILGYAMLSQRIISGAPLSL